MCLKISGAYRLLPNNVTRSGMVHTELAESMKNVVSQSGIGFAVASLPYIPALEGKNGILIPFVCGSAFKTLLEGISSNFGKMCAGLEVVKRAKCVKNLRLERLRKLRQERIVYPESAADTAFKILRDPRKCVPVADYTRW